MRKNWGILRTITTTYILMTAAHANAQQISGHIFDKTTGEPLDGVKIMLSQGNNTIATRSKLDGGFSTKQLSAGSYEITFKTGGYEHFKQNITVGTSNIELTPIYLSPEIHNNESVVVTSHGNKTTDQFNRNLERTAPFVLNSLSQRAIELSPDVTVANSLQRMSGVTIQRNSSGEGRYAIIRGMDQRYNTTLINGIKIPSPDDKYRYVPMDLFPSDMLERLEVVKSLTPSMEADAVGGVMNLVMKNAPNKETVHAFISSGSGTLFSNSRPFQSFDHHVISLKSPRELNGASYSAVASDFPNQNLILHKVSPINVQGGLTYGNRFFKKRLGMLIGISYQNNFKGSDQILNTQYPGARILTPSATGGTTYVDNYPQFNDAIINHYSTQNRRIGINNKWDFKINENNRISLYNFYVRMDEFQTRTSIDTNVNTNLSNVSLYVRTRWQIQDIYNSTLHGEHDLSDKFHINWNAVYSIAKQRIPDFSQYEVDYKKSGDTLAFSQVGNKTHIWTNNSDKDLAGYLNFVYNTKFLNRNLDISWGGLYRHKSRYNNYIKYSLNAQNSTAGFISLDSTTYDFSNSNAAAALGQDGTGRNYHITEDIGAAYGQFSYPISDNLQVLGGLRAEHTNQNYTTNLPITINAQKGHIYYWDLLPSLHFKYLIDNGKQNIWASYFRSLVRPSFAELIPQQIPATENDAYAQQGNPYVKHTTADNLDIRYGWFPKGADQLLVGAFYKRIHNPIETTFSHYNVFGGTTSPGANILTPTNIGDVRNYGVEFQFTKYFGAFGVNMNYTYTHSATTTTKYYYESRKTLGLADTTISRSQTRPMQGQAKHIGNIALLYKNSNIGFDAQVAYVYTGERIALVNTFYNMDTWQSPYGQLDFSFEKKILKRWSVYGKVNNLTNSQTRYFIKMPYIATLNNISGQDNPSKSIFVQRDTYKVSYLLGVKFKL